MATLSRNSALLLSTGLIGVGAASGLAYILVQRRKRQRKLSRLRDDVRIKLARQMHNLPPHHNTRGRITVVNYLPEWEAIEEEVKDRLECAPWLGLDCEWVSPREGAPHRIALIQLALEGGWCILLRMNKLQILPKGVAPIFLDPNILKLGVGVGDDAHKVLRDFGIAVRGWVDTAHIASALRPNWKKFGLAGQVQAFLGVTLDKNFKVRCGDWEADDLSKKQIHYAANDALSGLNVALVMAAEMADEGFESVSELCRPKASFTRLLRSFREISYKYKMRKNKSSSPDLPPVSFDVEKKLTSAKDPVKKMTVRKTPLYHNAQLEAPDGQQLCVCDIKKAKWYVAKGLGKMVREEPYTVRLTFEPSGRPEVRKLTYVNHW